MSPPSHLSLLLLSFGTNLRIKLMSILSSTVVFWWWLVKLLLLLKCGGNNKPVVVATAAAVESNPYQDRLKRFIRYKLIPYASIDALSDGQWDRASVCQTALLLAIVWCNLARFTLIALYPHSEWIDRWLVEYFAGQPNNVYFHMGIATLFVCPTLLCKCVFLFPRKVVNACYDDL